MNMEEEPFIEVIQRISSTREAEIVLVGLDAIKDTDKDDALNWVLANLARSGDTLIVLAVIYNQDLQYKAQPSCIWPFGRSGQIQQIDVATLEHLHEEISDKKELYMKSLRPFYDRCKTQGVKMKIKIAAGYSPAYITVHEANNVRASWIVLDRKLKKYKREIADSCGCNVAVMRRNNVASIVSSTSTNENKLPSYSISEGTITSTLPPRIISAPGEILRQGRPSIGVPVNLYLTGRAELAEDFAMFGNATTSESEIMIKSPSMYCSVCENTISGKPKLSGPVRQISCDEIKKITNNFAQDCMLAQNGISYQAYKGSVVEDGSCVYNVLVKKFEASYFETEFKTEIDILSVARHRNILTLLGFCNGKANPVLAYEYACNGSLDRYLSCGKEKMLSWATRRRIAIGVGKGLRYLNEECGDCTFVHRDIQPANILLTHDFSPLISNFGCARGLQTDEIFKECRVWGTPGYVAPECAERGIVSVKADAYSFGVLLLELISGRKALDLSRSEDQRSLVEWARPLIEIHAFHKLVDPGVADTADMYELYCMISAASVCIRKDPRSRASMSQVVSIIKGGRHVIIPPSPTIL